MSATLGGGLAVERTIKVTWNENTVEVTYETDALGKAFAELAGGARPTGGWVPLSAEMLAGPAALAAMLTRWDVEEDNGEPIPIAVEAWKHLPMSFLLTVLRDVIDDAFKFLLEREK
jgi:hypothetical protein